MKKTSFKAVLVAILLAALAVCRAAPSEAQVKIKVVNKRSHDLSFAFCWRLYEDKGRTLIKRIGWYSVSGGQSKAFIFNEALYDRTRNYFGYYAEGGGKVWQGKPYPDGVEVIINPKGKFDGYADDPIPGGKKVYFRIIDLKDANENDQFNKKDAYATLTFSE